MTLGSLSIFITSVIHLKLAIRSVSLQNHNNPYMQTRNSQNPIISYVTKLFAAIILCCVITHFTMCYYFFNYTILIFYLFPLPQIYFCAKNSIPKHCFNCYYNLLMWIPAIINPLMLKGYDHNFLRLTPMYSLSIGIPIMMVIQISVCILQRYLKPRFGCLKYFFGKPYNYFVAIKSLPDEVRDNTVCPICYGE